MNRTLRVCVATAVAVCLLALSPAVAPAFHYTSIVPYGRYIGTCDWGTHCQADNSTHTVYTGYLGPRFNAAVFKTLWLSYDTTDLKIQYESSWGSNTDVIYRYGNLPGNTAGWAGCNTVINTIKCGQFIVTFDSVQVCGDGVCSDRSLRELACHETGHTVGLLHGDEADPHVGNRLASLECMSTPLLEYSPREYLGSHNAGQINSVYPN